MIDKDNFIMQLKDHELKMWCIRNLVKLLPEEILASISIIIQQKMQKMQIFDKSILTDGIAYPETIALINEYYTSDLISKIQHKTWLIYNQKIEVEKKKYREKIFTDQSVIDPTTTLTNQFKKLCFDEPTTDDDN